MLAERLESSLFETEGYSIVHNFDRGMQIADPFHTVWTTENTNPFIVFDHYWSLNQYMPRVSVVVFVSGPLLH